MSEQSKLDTIRSNTIENWEYLYVTVYRKTGHNAAPFEKIFCCTYRVVGIQLVSSPSFIVVAEVVPTIIDLTVPFRRLETIHF